MCACCRAGCRVSLGRRSCGGLPPRIFAEALVLCPALLAPDAVRLLLRLDLDPLQPLPLLAHLGVLP